MRRAFTTRLPSQQGAVAPCCSAARTIGPWLVALGALVVAAAFPPGARGGCPLTVEISRMHPLEAQLPQRFGGAVAMTDTLLVVGSPWDDEAGAASGSVYVFALVAGTWTLDAKLLAPSGRAGDEFGRSVAVDGLTIVVGAPGADTGAPDTGAAFAYARSGVAWQLQGTLSPPAPVAGDTFGAAVALSGDRALVGAPWDDTAAADAGAVHAFARSAGTWSASGVLFSGAPSPSAGFGHSLDVAGGSAVVGAPWSSRCASLAGAAETFVHDGLAWREGALLCDPLPGVDDAFGHAVAIDAGRAAVSAPWDDDVATDAGAVHVFEGGPVSWGHAAKLLPPMAGASDGFGIAIALSGARLAVGAEWDDSAGVDAGAVHVFERGVVTWAPVAELLASDAAPADALGHSVAISILGRVASGAVWDDGGGFAAGACYVWSPQGQRYLQDAKLVPGDASAPDLFGHAVALDAATALVGAIWSDDAGPGAGSAHVFVEQAGAWVSEARLVAPTAAAGDSFGWSVALDGGLAAVSALWDDTAATDGGAVHVFAREGAAWLAEARLVPPGAAPGDGFGHDVSLSGGLLAVGAPWDDDRGDAAGSVHVFSRGADGTWSADAELHAPLGAAGEAFGHAVALAPPWLVVGAPWDSALGHAAGAVHVFRLVGATWMHDAVLRAPDAAADDAFGYDVAVHGDTLLVGAPWDDDLGDASGSAHLFVRGATAWTHRTKLLDPTGAALDAFGSAVALARDAAVVAAPWHGAVVPVAGSACLFLDGPSGWTAAGELALVDPRTGSSFGAACAAAATRALVGSPTRDAGTAHVFCGITPPESCADGTDEDGDSLVDCADPDCAGLPGPGGMRCEQPAELTCDDAADNDVDGKADCADPDCDGLPGPGGAPCEQPAERTCDDAVDNDVDGKADCADTDCVAEPACVAADYDGDGVPNGADCRPLDGTVWAAPGPCDGLHVAKLPPSQVLLSWSAPLDAGADAPWFDVAQAPLSTLGSGWSGVPCVLLGLTATTVDIGEPDGSCFWLVRAADPCGTVPAGGWGHDSLGAPRPACP